MWLYLLIFFIPVIAYFATDRNRNRSVTFLAVMMAFLALFVGISDMLGGYDRYIYAELFDSIAEDIRGGFNPFLGSAFNYYDSEKGYMTFNVLVAYLTQNRYLFILVLTLVVYTLLFFSLKKYAENYPLAVVLFMGLWFFFTFTYLRQVMGASIAWLSIQYIIKRNWKLFFLVMAIAFTFHNSAIILIPFYFVPIKKLSPSTIITIMVLCLIIGLTPLPQSLFEAYGEVDEDRLNAANYAMDAGFRYAYLFESIFLLSVILYNYRDIPNKPQNIVMLNIALAFCAILLVFIRSENGGRLSWYYMLGIITTLTNIATRKGRQSPYSIMVLTMSLLLYIRIVTGWSYMLSPYKTFFSNGHREYDPIYEQFEYDDSYDLDKFYKW